MGKSKRIVLIIIFILLIGILGIEVYSKVVIGSSNENNVTSTDSYGSGEPPKVENTNVEEEAEENIEDEPRGSNADFDVPRVMGSFLTAGYFDLDDEWSSYYYIDAETALDPEQNFDLGHEASGLISNIVFFLVYKGEEYTFTKNSSNYCTSDPDGKVCRANKLSDSLNNMSLYITCKGEFPEEHFDLTDEQYENVKKEYDSFVANPTVEYTGVSGKCISDRGY